MSVTDKFKDIDSELSNLEYNNQIVLDKTISRIKTLIYRFWGSDSHYLLELGEINYTPKIWPVSDVYLIEAWNEGVTRLRSLVSNLTKDVEDFGITMSDNLSAVGQSGLNSNNPQILIQGDIKMSGDQYNVGQAGAVGANAKAENMTFNQIQLGQIDKLDLTELANELTQLRNSLANEAANPEHYIEIGAIAEAEKAALEGDKSEAIGRLKSVGKWSLDVATTIGTRVAAEAIKISLGM